MNKFAAMSANTEGKTMKNVIKKITATALCGVLAAGSAFAVSAAPKSVEKSQERFEVTGETQQINNNYRLHEQNLKTVRRFIQGRT